MPKNFKKKQIDELITANGSMIDGEPKKRPPVGNDKISVGLDPITTDRAQKMIAPFSIRGSLGGIATNSTFNYTNVIDKQNFTNLVDLEVKRDDGDELNPEESEEEMAAKEETIGEGVTLGEEKLTKMVEDILSRRRDYEDIVKNVNDNGLPGIDILDKNPILKRKVINLNEVLKSNELDENEIAAILNYFISDIEVNKLSYSIKQQLIKKIKNNG